EDGIRDFHVTGVQTCALPIFRDQKQFVADNGKQIDSILNLITALLAFAIIIATFGIINTLLLSVVERTREIGLLRAVGLQRRQKIGRASCRERVGGGGGREGG